MPQPSGNSNQQLGQEYIRTANGRHSASNAATGGLTQRAVHNQPKAQRDGAEPARLRMVCGDCCLPSCYVKERVTIAFKQQLDVATSGEYVVVKCTSAECPMGGQLHRECYDKLEERCLAIFSNVAGRVTKPRPEAEKRRMLWKSGTKGYYDRVQKLCRCACGSGLFQPLESGPGQVLLRGGERATDGADDPAEARARAIAQKLARKRELQEARDKLQREQELKHKAESTRRNEKHKQMRQEQKQQTAVLQASELGVNVAAHVFDPSDRAAAAAAARAAAAAAAARAQLAAKREAAARDELQSVRVRGELWARKGGRGERSSAGPTEPDAATGGNYHFADDDDADLAQVRVRARVGAVPWP
jgi:hypothetical protein